MYSFHHVSPNKLGGTRIIDNFSMERLGRDCKRGLMKNPKLKLES